ncbi:MAG: hypothetical protein HY531_01375 [Chloroflexi bacterium]|nr:hypothetical protein [Chloroflexota bacterium]
MSKLLDRLDAIDRGAPRAMGFAAHANQKPAPSLALLAWCGDLGRSDLASLATLPVDSFILPGGSSPEDLAKKTDHLGKAIWGIAVNKLVRTQAAGYREKGSDFLVFGIEETMVDALEEGECARVLRIPPHLEEPQLRGLEDLPVDIVLLQRPKPEGPLRLAHLLAISNVRAMTSRYLLLEWDLELTARELEHLRDVGVDGIVLNVEAIPHSIFTTLRERIDKLPHRKPRGEQRPVAVLPRAGGPANTRPQRHEEDDDEEIDEP